MNAIEINNVYHSPYYLNCSGEADHGDSYDWITDRVAIGDYTSSYKGFDVVINLNFPNVVFMFFLLLIV
jgi:hypothetical protein